MHCNAAGQQDEKLGCVVHKIFSMTRICLIDLIFTSQSTIFQLCRDGSSWDEPVLSKDKCVLLKETTQ